MSISTTLYVSYRDTDGREKPWKTGWVILHFDPYIPGLPEEDSDERFNALEQVGFGDLPDFVREEYGEDGDGRWFAQMTLAEFHEGHAVAIRKFMERKLFTLEALGMKPDPDSDVFDLQVETGEFDDNYNRVKDFEKTTWRIDKKLVTKECSMWDDMAIGVECMGIYRVIRDGLPHGVDDSDVRMILARS